MNKKKFITAVSAAAVGMAAITSAASASCTTNRATGEVKWDFVDYGNLNLGLNYDTRYLFCEANGVFYKGNNIKPEDQKDVLIIETHDHADKITDDGLFMVDDEIRLYYTPNVSGKFSVKASALRKDTYIELSTSDNTNKFYFENAREENIISINCSEGNTITVAAKAPDSNQSAIYIPEITFTPDTSDKIYTFNAPFSEMNGLSLNVNYTDANGTDMLTKSISDLWGSDPMPMLSGEAQADFGVKITGVPASTTINSVTIAE